MATTIRLPRQQVEDLKAIAALKIDALKAIVTHLRSLRPSPLQPKQLRDEISSLLPGQDSVADAIIRQMLRFHSLIGQRRLEIDELFSGLEAGIRAAKPTWQEVEIAAWKEREQTVRDLFAIDAVRIVAKALDLSYEYANLLRTARIITDLRPVFTLDAKATDGAVISHKLFIRYDNVEGLKTFTMTLDEEDVKTLKRECERALQKTETISLQLGKGSPIRTIIPGRDDND